tara:strand:+ start:644 stop:2998 length:2355 start_codon:yes stop_codon:yes gene_type:complete
MANKKSINLFLGLNSSQFQKGLTKAQRRLKKFGSSMKRVGKSMTTSLTLPLVGIGAIAGKTFMDFEQSMLKVKAISGATGEEFKALEANAKALGSSTMFTASQVAGLQLELSKLGLTPGQINESTSSILSLAQATDSDLSQAAEVAAKTMNAFGLEASDMNRIADVMADSFSSSALDMGKFETAMASVAPVAKQAGSDIEQTTAILGVLVNNGVEASTAGTALRNIFLDLAKEGKTMGQAMAEIQNSTNPLATSMEMFGKRGATVATILANNGKEIQSLNEDFRDSEGEAKRMADIMDSGLGGSLRKLKSQLEGVAIQLGEMLIPIFQKLMSVFSSVLTHFSSLSGSMKTVAVTLGILIAGIGPAISLIGAMATAFAALTGPIGLAIGAILGIVAAFVYVRENWDAFKERLGDWRWWKNALIQALQWLIEFNPLSMVLEGFNTVLEFFGKNTIPNPFEKIADGLDDLKSETKTYENEFGSFTDAVKNQASEAADAIGLMGAALGVGGGGSAQSASTTTGAFTMGPEEFDYGSFMPEPEDDGGFWNKSAEDITEWANTAIKAIEEFEKTWGRAVNQAASIYNQFIQGQIETDKQKLEADLEKLEADKEREIFAVQNAIMTEQEKEDALLAIDEDFADKAETLQENQATKERALKRKQAKAQKVADLFSVASYTAKAVMGAVAAYPASGGLPFSAINAALGVAQAGAIMAAPLPALAEGGLAFGPTAALVGDNPGAQADPEVIAPLSKLQGMMGNSVQTVRVIGEISGENIVLASDRYNTNKNRMF